MTHAEVFRQPSPAFANPDPMCHGMLALITSDRAQLVDGGWDGHEQQVYRCQSCSCRIGLIDGRVYWVERTVGVAVAERKPANGQAVPPDSKVRPNRRLS